jgi:hypothetical protein
LKRIDTAPNDEFVVDWKQQIEFEKPTGVTEKSRKGDGVSKNSHWVMFAHIMKLCFETSRLRWALKRRCLRLPVTVFGSFDEASVTGRKEKKGETS